MSTKTQEPPPFGKWRAFFWPIHTYELKKLLPMLFLFFFILFNYTVLRDTKDTLIVTAPGSGAEAIPFLKVWGVLPGAFLFMFLYNKLSNIMSKPALFYTSVIPFIIFFGIFSTLIYPNRELLHPHGLCDTLQNVLPAGCKGLIAILRNWTYSLFYVMSELWGSVCISLLFWGFANDITKTSESKRFYNLFGLGANFSLLFAGTAVIWASDLRRSLSKEVADPWGVSLNWLMLMVVASGLVILATYWWINRYVLTDERFYDPKEQQKMKKDRPKMGFLESFKYLLSSKYVGCLAILVIGYGMCINLVEVTWKSQLKLAYPDANAYSAFMGNFSRLGGLVTIFMMLFVTGNVVRRLGWRCAALLTPVVLLVTGSLFFAFMLFNNQLAGMIAYLGTSPLMLAVVFGTLQNIVSKSSKYSLFDPTKEMLYIPLDQDIKVKGKAAIDVVGARLGKSGGALMQQMMILALGSIAAMAPYIGFILLAIIVAWILAVNSVNKQYQDILEKRAKEEAAENQSQQNATAMKMQNSTT